MSLKDRPGQLFARIQRMITGENGPLGSKGKLLLLGGALALAALCVFSNMRPAAATAIAAVTPVVPPVVVTDTVPAKKYVPFAKPKHQTEKNKNLGSPKAVKAVRSKDTSIVYHYTYDSASTYKLEAPNTKMDTLYVNYQYNIDKKAQAMNVQVKDLDVQVNNKHNLQVSVQDMHNLDVQVRPLNKVNVQLQPVQVLDVKTKPLQAINQQAKPVKQVKPEKADKPGLFTGRLLL